MEIYHTFGSYGYTILSIHQTNSIQQKKPPNLQLVYSVVHHGFFANLRNSASNPSRKSRGNLGLFIKTPRNSRVLNGWVLHLFDSSVSIPQKSSREMKGFEVWGIWMMLMLMMLASRSTMMDVQTFFFQGKKWYDVILTSKFQNVLYLMIFHLIWGPGRFR